MNSGFKKALATITAMAVMLSVVSAPANDIIGLAVVSTSAAAETTDSLSLNYSESADIAVYASAPSAMKGFKLGGRASDALRLNWTKNTSADGYIIEQYKSGKWVRIKKITSNATTTLRVTGLKAGTAYKFRMRAYKMSGSKALYTKYTSTLSARTNPSNVSGFKIGGKASDALRLNWTKNTSADGYIIEQYKSGKWVRIKKITSNATTTLRVTGLKAGTTYKFRMRAYKMSGSKALYSGYTSTLSGKTSTSSTVSAPTNLKQSSCTERSVTVSWSAVSGATKYEVQIYEDGAWSSADTVTGTKYTFNYLDRETTYKVRVRYYKGKWSSYSSSITIGTKPDKVYGPYVDKKTTESMSVYWDLSNYATGYEVQISEDGVKWTTYKTSSTKYTFKNLQIDTKYNVRVRVYKNIGSSTIYSDYSRTYTYSTDGLSRPTSLAITDIGADFATISWDAVEGADGYIVKYKLANGAEREDKTPSAKFTMENLKVDGYFYARVTPYVITASGEQITGYSDSILIETLTGFEYFKKVIKSKGSFTDGMYVIETSISNESESSQHESYHQYRYYPDEDIIELCCDSTLISESTVINSFTMITMYSNGKFDVGIVFMYNNDENLKYYGLSDSHYCSIYTLNDDFYLEIYDAYKNPVYGSLASSVRETLNMEIDLSFLYMNSSLAEYGLSIPKIGFENFVSQ